MVKEKQWQEFDFTKESIKIHVEWCPKDFTAYIRYTYYIAEDRTFDLFPNSKNGKTDYEDRKHAIVEEIQAGELFIYYLYRADDGGYGTTEINNKYNLDPLTVVFNYDVFKRYVQNYNANDVDSLMGVGNPYRHKYLDNMDLKGMKKRIGVSRKQNGLCWLYYKEFFEGEEKPDPAPEFFDILRNLGCRYPEKISFWHVEEVDDNGNVVRSVESSES